MKLIPVAYTIIQSRDLPARLLAMIVVVVLTLFGTGVPAQAEMTKQQIIGQIERDYSVKVLGVRQGEKMGKGVFSVTVMNPPGNFNEAFQINTIAFDVKSGKLVPVAAQTPQGYRLPAPAVTLRTSPRTAETP